MLSPPSRDKSSCLRPSHHPRPVLVRPGAFCRTAPRPRPPEFTFALPPCLICHFGNLRSLLFLPRSNRFHFAFLSLNVRLLSRSASRSVGQAVASGSPARLSPPLPGEAEGPRVSAGVTPGLSVCGDCTFPVNMEERESWKEDPL